MGVLDGSCGLVQLAIGSDDALHGGLGPGVLVKHAARKLEAPRQDLGAWVERKFGGREENERPARCAGVGADGSGNGCCEAGHRVLCRGRRLNSVEGCGEHQS